MSLRNPKTTSYHRGLLAVVLLLVFMASPVLALDPAKSIFQFNCQSWTRQTGLPSDKINAIAQTRDGYLWFATQNGLVRFDGNEFKVVPMDLPPSKEQEVKSLAVSSDDRLLFAINNDGFGSYDGKTFSRVGDDKWIQPGLNANAVLLSRKGALWGGSDMGISRWVRDQPDQSLFEESVPLVISLAEDPAGRIWAGTAEQGLLCWADGKFIHILDPVLKQRNLFALAADQKGQVWVGTGNGLFCCDARGQVREFPSVTGEVKALLLDSHGILWIGTSGNGLLRYQNGVITHLNKIDGLASDYITSLFEDAEGSLWVGTRDGLSQLTDVKFPIYSSLDGIPVGSATSVTVARRGGLWITTASGLSWFDGRNIRNYTNGPGLFPFYVKLGMEARNGDFYMVDGNKTIDVLSGDKITPIYTNSIWADSLVEDSESVLAGVGSVLYRIKDGKLQPYVYQTGTRALFYWINNLYITRDGAIWVASNNGIFRIQNGSFKNWVSGERAMCLFEDLDGSVWAGEAGGVVRIKNGQVKLIRQEDGIADDRINSIVADDHGCLWFNSGNGIFRATREALNDFADGKTTHVACETFTGLESVKFTDRVDQEPSGCKTADGRIWFPNPKGVVMIDPGHYFTNRIAPRVSLQQVTVNDQELKDRNAPVFHAGDKKFEFSFCALSFIAPKKIQVQYQLSGYDPQWIDAGSRRSALYNDLKPGSYKFKIRAGNADGVWAEAGGFAFEIPPPYYETLWFKCLGGLVAALALLGAFRWNVRLIENHQRRLQAQNDLLEAKVTARTSDLTRENQERRQAEEQLRKSQSQLAQAQQIAHMGSWEWDLATNQVSWSDETQRLYGRTPEEMGSPMETCIQNRIHPDDRERVNQTMAESVRTRQSFVCDHRIILPDGRERIMQGRGEIQVNAQGEPVKMFGIVQDITEARRAQEALQRSEDQLQHAQKMEAVGRLAGGVAHDFNNLLTVINGYCALALSKEEEVQPVRKNIEEIQKAAGRAASLTSQLLAFSRKQVLQPRVVQLNEVVSGMEKMLRRLIGEDIELSTAYDATLGNIHADPGQIEQVIMNLVVNARDAMPRGGKLAIKTSNTTIDHQTISRNRTLEPGEYVLIAISDNGVGMNDDVQSHLFEPFFTTKGLGKGTGLGLATCYGIICQSGGDIRVYSELNAGTTFKIYLPRTDAAVETIAPSNREYLSTGTESILVVEDDSAVRTLAVTILRGCGYQVQESTNAFEALRLLKKNPRFDLVLTDVIMPQMSGKELCDQIKSQLPHIKVLLMSGYTDDALAHHGVLDENLLFLEKPFSPAKLARKVREVLDLPRALPVEIDLAINSS